MKINKVIKMMYEEHCELSKKKFGEDGAEFHKWIDSYAKFGYRHRQVLHHQEGIEVGVQIFGEKCRRHLELHIRKDYSLKSKEKIPTIQDLRNTYFPFQVVDGLLCKNNHEV